MKDKLHRIRETVGKATALMLISVYLLFSVGIIKATHFCMGRKASESFFTSEAKKCPCSKFATEKNTCCDDEHDLIRIENEQKIISTITLSVPEWFVLEDLYTSQWVAAIQTSSDQPANLSDNPRPPKIPLWKTHHTFVFYEDELIG